MSKESIIISIESDALWILCQEYDRVEGRYPESPYEGAALFSYFREIMVKHEEKAR